LALEVAESCGGDIVNADSLQVYRDLRILTARPSAQDEARVPHHGYGFLEALDTFSAGTWQRWAEATIQKLQPTQKPIFVVGGTGLYLKALIQGLAKIPPVDPAIRLHLQQRLHAEGIASLYHELQHKDAMIAHKLSSQDTQRILRALEIVEATGRPLSYWQAQPASRLPLQVKAVLLCPERSRVIARAEARVQQMMQQGAIEEIQALIQHHIPLKAPVFRALGAQALYRYLHQEISLETAIALTQTVTRQYIKRQYTWFRHQIQADYAFEEVEPATLVKTFRGIIQKEIA
jgi:tRNA dimethylallyltransferase